MILRPTLRTVVASAVLVSGCAPLLKPDGADQARAALTALRLDATLASQVPTALTDAELAVQAAEVPTRDAVAGQHAAHVALRKVEIARAEAERRVAEADVAKLRQQREAILANAREQELEIARAQAEAAAAAALAQQQAALATEAEAAQRRALDESLRFELARLGATLVAGGAEIALDDSRFVAGKPELQVGAMQQLEALAGFLNGHPEMRLMIVASGDAASEAPGQALALKRADAVRAYLIIQGVEASRLTSVLQPGSEQHVNLLIQR